MSIKGMKTVSVYQMPSHVRSKILVDALLRGIKAAGDVPRLRWVHHYQQPDSDLAAIYGYEGRAVQVVKDYSNVSKCVFLDLGYWGRHAGGRYAGYHKLVINMRHATPYFQKKPKPMDRFQRLGISIKPWRNTGRYVLVCGMGGKGAMACGYPVEEWEKWAINQIKKYTDRPIMYRPKASWRGARPLPGTVFHNPQSEFGEALAQAWCVVSHHSNCNVDGILEGVPSFCIDGVALPLSCSDLSQIEKPFKPDNREQWAADLSYVQWNVGEIADGTAWRYLKTEGLIP